MREMVEEADRSSGRLETTGGLPRLSVAGCRVINVVASGE